MTRSKEERLAEAKEIEAAFIEDDLMKFGPNFSTPQRRLATLVRESIEAERDIVRPRPVLCPTCKGEGATSEVTRGQEMPSHAYHAEIYDRQGEPTGSDPIHRRTNYNCSRGHHWRVRD